MSSEQPHVSIRSTNPFMPSETVVELPRTSLTEAEAAIGAAAGAQSRWAADAHARSVGLGRMAESVLARRDQFIDVMVREVGKPVAEAAGEVDRAAAILRYYSQVALDANGETFPGSAPGAQNLVRRDPLGVILAICPWNFPLAIPLWKAAPALAYGNAVLIKPAGAAVAVCDLLVACAEESIPNEILSQVRISGSEAGDLLDDPRVAAVTFTGSSEVGLSVVQRMARRGAPAQAEMGGQNAAIVLDDADLDAAADALVSGAMGYAGQKCTATRRVVAVASIAGEFEQRLARRIEALEVGDPANDEVTVGPLIDASAAADFERAVADALAAGGREIARAGEEGRAEGHMVRPALIRQDDPNAVVNQEETFGPLLTFLRVQDEDEAIAAANSTEYGLSGAVHGRDLGRAVNVAAQLGCGLRRVNAPTPGVDYYAPFGGEGKSSFGPREQGRAAAEFFTRTSTMTVVPSAGTS